MVPDGNHGGLVDPIWAGVSHPAAPDRTLMIRHDGIGWLAFLFSQKEARSLADYLMKGLPESDIAARKPAK